MHFVNISFDLNKIELIAEIELKQLLIPIETLLTITAILGTYSHTSLKTKIFEH